MVNLNLFKNQFNDDENEYVIIGGTACELLMSKKDLIFRATKDIDMILIVESLTKEFGKTLWNSITKANYQFINKGTGISQFYRFYNSKSNEYPEMIELFSKNQN